MYRQIHLRLYGRQLVRQKFMTVPITDNWAIVAEMNMEEQFIRDESRESFRIIRKTQVIMALMDWTGDVLYLKVEECQKERKGVWDYRCKLTE